MSEALYRKYRPQTFEDVVGQTHIERTLKNAIEQDKVGHAYMFCGPRGTGKTTTARLLAKALLCEKGPTPAPDGTCEQCVAIAEGNHPDVYELDAASRTGVDNVREEIIGRVQYAPTRGRYKVYIIDEVHMLSIAAFNALLKTLEEPPSHVVFIMCTTDPQKVPETIQSRCQRFDFHRLSNEEIISRLGAVCTAENVQFEGDALDLVAHRAQGGMRDALTILEQLIAFGDGNVTVEVANDVLGSLDVDDMSGIVRSIAQRDAAACFTWVSEYVETGADLARFVRDLAAYVRDLYVLSLTDGAVAVNAPQNALPRMAGEAQMFGIDRLAYILRVLGDLNTELRTSTNPRLTFEIGLTRMVRPQSDLTLESLAARVEVLERALAQGAMAQGAPAAAVPAASAPAAQPAATVPASANAGYRQPVSTAAPASAAARVQPAVTQAQASRASASRSVQPQAAPAAASNAAAAPVDKAAEFRAQLEQRRARRAGGVAAISSAPAPAPRVGAAQSASAPVQAAAAPTTAVASDEVRAKIGNAAALQRGWQTALADLKRQRAAYGALLLSARVVAQSDASGIDIEFSPENSFAFTAAQKPDITAALQAALSAAFGGAVPFRITQGSSASAAAVAPAAASAPRAQQPARAASRSQDASRQAPAAPQQTTDAPPWEDDVVPYTDADIAAYMPEDEQPPFSAPDASHAAGAPSHQEVASQENPFAGRAMPNFGEHHVEQAEAAIETHAVQSAKENPFANRAMPAFHGEGESAAGTAIDAPAPSSHAAKPNPFANRKMPEGIGKGAPAQPAASEPARPAAKPVEEKGAKPAKKRKTAADKLAEAVAQFGDAMLVVGPKPVDPFPMAQKLGFDSMPDPKLKSKSMTKPKGWPMPADARLLEGKEIDVLAQAGDSGAAADGNGVADAQPAAPAPSAPVEPELPPEPPAPIPAQPARPNPFANRAMPKGIGGGSSSGPAPSNPAAAPQGGNGEMSIEEIFGSFGVSMDKVTEER